MPSATVGPEKLALLLGEHAERAPVTVTYCITPGGPAPSVESLPADLTSTLVSSPTGAFLLASAERALLVVPPFPVLTDESLEGWHADAVLAHLDEPRVVGVLLLRLGGYAVAVYRGRTLLASKVGTRFVKGRHGKGGSSQARFARRREEQAKALYRKACQAAETVLAGHADDIDHFLYGGDRRTVSAFEKHCDYVGCFEPKRLGRFLHVGEPRQATLEALPRMLYESLVVTAPTAQEAPP